MHSSKVGTEYTAGYRALLFSSPYVLCQGEQLLVTPAARSTLRTVITAEGLRPDHARWLGRMTMRRQVVAMPVACPEARGPGGFSAARLKG